MLSPTNLEPFNRQDLDAQSLKRCDILVRAVDIVDICPSQVHASNFLSSKSIISSDFPAFLV